MMRPDFAEMRGEALCLRIRLTPGSAVDRIEGVGETAGGRALLVRVRAVPEKGLANAALVRLIAEAAGWPRSTLSLDAGAKSRVKLVEVSGDPARLASGLARLHAATVHQP